MVSVSEGKKELMDAIASLNAMRKRINEHEAEGNRLVSELRAAKEAHEEENSRAIFQGRGAVKKPKAIHELEGALAENKEARPALARGFEAERQRIILEVVMPFLSVFEADAERIVRERTEAAIAKAADAFKELHEVLGSRSVMILLRPLMDHSVGRAIYTRVVGSEHDFPSGTHHGGLESFPTTLSDLRKRAQDGEPGQSADALLNILQMVHRIEALEG